MEFYHSAKGTTWKNHKYIAIKNGRYIYSKKSSSTVSKTAKAVGKVGTLKKEVVNPYTTSIKEKMDKGFQILNETAAKGRLNAASEQTRKIGEAFIKDFLKSNADFKSTGILEMEVRGLKKQTKVTLGEKYIGKHK